MALQPSESEPTVDLTGKRIGEYLLIRRLGRGGMADVYLAEQESLKRNVALKILKPDLAKDNSYVKRFHREAQAAARLVQANIVQIYEVGDADGFHFIAQEYVQGRNLRQYLTRHGAVEPVMAINVLRQCGMALQKAGELDVIHRDIKPENIMLSTKGEIKVTDFGLARVNNQESKLDLTQIGITMGTPLYMSPEQVEGLSVDPRSDIYSLGVTVYHMLAGNPPFEGDNALSIAVQHVKNDPEPLEQIRPDAPPELCQLIHRMVAKNPDDRPANASSLMREIRKIKIDVDQDWDDLIEKLSISETMAIGAATVPASKLEVTQQLQSVMKGNVRSWWKSSPTLLLFALLALLGFAGGAYYSIQNPVKDPLDVGRELLDTVSKKESVDLQFNHAYFGNTEQHWKAVIDFFPIDDVPPRQKYATQDYHRMAKEKLGKLYMDENDLDKALEIYSELSDITDTTATRFNTIGWAGMAIIYHRNNDPRLARALENVDPNRDNLPRYLREQIDLINTEMARPPLDRDSTTNSSTG